MKVCQESITIAMRIEGTKRKRERQKKSSPLVEKWLFEAK